MADSTKGKDKKTLDAFAEDLDAMLKIDETPAAQQVGAIEDDDAIDRLLMGDNFSHTEVETERDEFADIDALIGDDLGDGHKLASEIDEFGDDIDDMIANIQGEADRSTGPAIDTVDEFADLAEDAELVKNVDEVETPELTALETVGEIDEFADEFSDEKGPIPAGSGVETDEIEGMKEIDEFSDVSQEGADSADFLMADFDISSDDDVIERPQTEQAADEFADDVDTAAVESVRANEQVSIEQPPEADAQAIEDEFEEIEADVRPAAVEKEPRPVDHDTDIAALQSQITVLKKQHQVFRQELTEKAGNAQLLKYEEEFDRLQAEHKKARRAIEAIGHQKPVAAYIAAGIAVTGLLVAVGLGFQGYIAKSQIAELVPIIGKLQEHATAPAASDVADREMLRKQVEALTAANAVASGEIAEIKKAMQSGAESTPVSGDLGKQLTELSNHNMEMGAAIEALQSKVSALEKGGTAKIVPVSKPAKKKPVVAEQNWAVNLIAFKQEWYAKRKAEEFAGKGVPVKVSKTVAKGETWYRLSVDGFKSQYEAAGYAAKVKKTLNLDSVWVTRNKE